MFTKANERIDEHEKGNGEKNQNDRARQPGGSVADPRNVKIIFSDLLQDETQDQWSPWPSGEYQRESEPLAALTS